MLRMTCVFASQCTSKLVCGRIFDITACFRRGECRLAKRSLHNAANRRKMVVLPLATKKSWVSIWNDVSENCYLIDSTGFYMIVRVG